MFCVSALLTSEKVHTNNLSPYQILCGYSSLYLI